jgi:uncharacterized membrane protein
MHHSQGSQTQGHRSPFKFARFWKVVVNNPAMAITYNRIAGHSVERLAALSDGIFGVAMTLLLLDVHIPRPEQIHTEMDLLRALAAISPTLLVYLMSFITLGIYWVVQQTQLNHLESSDRQLTWMYLAFLFCVTLVPFSTNFLTDFIPYRTALLAYWFNILLLGTVLLFCWNRAVKVKLVKQDVSAEVCKAIYHRIIYGQFLYAVGASICVFSTRLSIACIILVQLNYVITPRFVNRTKQTASENSGG